MSTSSRLTISRELDLPLDTVTDTIGILAIKGAGKTYTFLVLVEEMAKHGLPVVVLDPVGVCWGLRSSADASGPGLPVVIVGGQHGDVPLEEGAGAVLADWVIAERRPAVFDLSELPTKAASIRFALDFLSRLYQAANRQPIHVVLDEADEFAPQKPFGEETRLLRAVEVLVRRGRAKGLGVTMVTQRPAVLSKNVLTQIGTLVVGAMRAPQDRKAVEEWVNAHATTDQKKTFMASLASLPTREKWVWSPARDVFARVAIRARETFDSSATPKVGEVRVEPQKLAPVDLEALRGRIAATIEEAKADDPKALKARIKELESQLAEFERQAEAIGAWTEPRHVEVERVPRFLYVAAIRALSSLHAAVDTIGNALNRVDRDGLAPAAEEDAEASQAADASAVVAPPPPPPPRAAPAPSKSNGAVQLRAGERRLLEVAARHHPVRLTRAQLATLAGFTASGGTYQTYLSVLRRAGYFDEEEAKLVGVTAAGLAAAGVKSRRPMTRAEVLEQWRRALRAGERTMLDLVIKHGELTRSNLGALAKLEPKAGTFGTYLSVLKRNGLVVVDGQKVRLGKALAEAR